MLYPLSLSGVPQSGLDLTTDLGSLLTGLVILLTVSLLGILFTIGADRAREVKLQHSMPEDLGVLPKAA
jgi:hypothetical protein